MHAKLERLLSKSLTTLEVMAYYLVVHTGPEVQIQDDPHHRFKIGVSVATLPTLNVIGVIVKTSRPGVWNKAR